MNFNFDQIINRRNTSSLKYDFAEKYGRPKDALPLWVADMDFAVAPAITEVIQNYANHAIYGYTESDVDYFSAVQNWFVTQHNVQIEKDWIVKTPGVTFAVGMAIKAFTEVGDAVLIQKPLYYPIENTIVANSRKLIDNSLLYEDGRYAIDFADFEEKIIQHKVKMFILCNPHNPVGRVWTLAELQEMSRICKKYNCLVVSDEVHCDLIFGQHKHIVYSTIDENSVILTAPSKTFNIAGLQVSNAFIPDINLREKFAHEISATGYSQLNTMGIIAATAAYKYGLEWLNELLEYLGKNVAFVTDFFAANLPQVHVVHLEGTYLMWLDFNALGISHQQMQEKFDGVKLWLSSGAIFGDTGNGFWRMNIACPQATLKDALERILLCLK